MIQKTCCEIKEICEQSKCLGDEKTVWVLKEDLIENLRWLCADSGVLLNTACFSIEEIEHYLFDNPQSETEQNVKETTNSKDLLLKKGSECLSVVQDSNKADECINFITNYWLIK